MVKKKKNSNMMKMAIKLKKMKIKMVNMLINVVKKLYIKVFCKKELDQKQMTLKLKIIRNL